MDFLSQIVRHASAIPTLSLNSIYALDIWALACERKPLLWTFVTPDRERVLADDHHGLSSSKSISSLHFLKAETWI